MRAGERIAWPPLFADLDKPHTYTSKLCSCIGRFNDETLQQNILGDVGILRFCRLVIRGSAKQRHRHSARNAHNPAEDHR